MASRLALLHVFELFLFYQFVMFWIVINRKSANKLIDINEGF